MSKSSPIDIRDGLSQAAAFVLVGGGWLSLLGPLSPILVMLGSAALVALSPQRALGALSKSWPLLLIGVLAMLSATWSTAPGVSLRYGVQLAITLVAAVILSGSLPLEKLVRTFFLTGFTVLVICILSGRQGGSPSGPVLIGILGSKNEMGALCQLTICSGACVFLRKEEKLAIKLLAGLGALVGTTLLLSTFATGAFLSTLMFGGFAAVFLVGSRLSSGAKVLLVAGVALLVVPLLLIHGSLEAYWRDFVVDVLKKDVGLTGRDYLWAHADRLIHERPLVGHGYRSTWLGDSTETIGLLRWAGLSTGAGFNFHDTFRELGVDFGIVGAFAVCLSFGVGLFRLLVRAFSKDIVAPIVFFAATAFILAIRAKVELVIGPFNSSGILLAATAAVGFQLARPAIKRPIGRRAFIPRRLSAQRANATPAPSEAT